MNISLPIYASETTLTTTVPNEISMNLEIEGKGIIRVEEKIYSESTEIVVKRNEWISYEISPSKNYEIKSVFFNGEDVTKKLKYNIFKAFSDKSGTLKVIFIVAENNPTTSDSSNLLGAAYIMLLSTVTFIIIIFHKKKEQSI